MNSEIDAGQQDIENERLKYDDVWATDHHYRHKCHGLELWQQRRDLFPDDIDTAFDLGCGTGRLVGEWLEHGIRALGVDFSTYSVDAELLRKHPDNFIWQCLWKLDLYPLVSDIGICADVKIGRAHV